MSGSDVLAPLREQLEHTAVALDYDGTLAPIVDDPAHAMPLPAARAALAEVAERAQLTLIVSGRPVDFLREHVALDRVTLVGQYGLERLVGADVQIDDRALPYLDAVAAATEDATRRWPDLLVERKGRLAVTVHWRTRGAGPPDRELLGLAQEHGLAMLHGRKSCELRPPVPVDKGSAFASILVEVRPRAALFAGDDRGDLSAFTALDDLAADGSLRHAVRVGVRSDEAPAEILERADVVVDGPDGVADLLSSLGRP